MSCSCCLDSLDSVSDHFITQEGNHRLWINTEYTICLSTAYVVLFIYWFHLYKHLSFSSCWMCNSSIQVIDKSSFISLSHFTDGLRMAIVLYIAMWWMYWSLYSCNVLLLIVRMRVNDCLVYRRQRRHFLSDTRGSSQLEASLCSSSTVCPISKLKTCTLTPVLPSRGFSSRYIQTSKVCMNP